MNPFSRSRILILSGLAASLIVAAMLILVLTGSAVAGIQVDSMAYLPVVTSPIVQTDIYETDFTHGIEPWKAVRWHKGASYDVTHNSGGSLDVKIKTNDTYVIVSPLIAGPQAPYNILFRAKLHDRKDKAQYGVIFGADWQGAPCPGDNSDGCFNHYYEFRARYRDISGEKYMEYRIRRVDGHGGNNVEQGTDLITWTRVTGANAEDWNKWEVHYGSSGNIRVKANNVEQAQSARDGKYTLSRYFGVYAKAGENGSTNASFDKFDIAAE